MKKLPFLTVLTVLLLLWQGVSISAPKKVGKQQTQVANSDAIHTKSDERGTDASPLVVRIVPSEKPVGVPPAKSENGADPTIAEVRMSLVDWATFISAIAALASTFAAFVMLYFNYSLAKSTIKLWEESKKAGDTAEKAARAAEKAAEAAMASLDRPWLVIEGLECNRSRWIARETGLLAKFRVANYGNAPAFVLSLNAAFFLSAADFKKIHPSVLLPDGVKDIPSADALRQFVSKYARPIRIRDGLPATNLREAVFDSGLGISSRGRSQEYFSHEIAKIELLSNGIALVSTFPVFLIGYILYSAPNGEMGAVNFCYEMGHDGVFRERYGAPYNERKRDYDIRS